MEQLIVREYLRVSKDVHQTGRSLDQQHAENAREIHQRGWKLHPAAPYRDTDRSASRYAKKPRENFKRLIGDLESDEFDADVLAIWESSRGSRRVGEWVDLVDLCKSRGVQIWVTTHRRLYDPANARDRRSLLEDAVDAEYESDKTSERRRRSARASADAGRPHGRNTYGYVRVYDDRTRELLRVEPHPEQAPIVREVARRVLLGEAFYTIARDLNREGVPPRRGKRVPPHENAGWSPSAVKQMLRLPAYAGKRDYRGAIVGDGMWPALISFEDWQRLQAIVAGTHRKGPRDHTAKHLLTGIARCAVCGAPLKRGSRTYQSKKVTPDGSPVPRTTYAYYVCGGIPGRSSPGASEGWHVGMKVEHLNAIVVDLLFGRFEHPDFLFSLSTQSDETRAERAQLKEAIDAHESYLESVRQRAATERRFDLILDQESRVMPLIEGARQRLGELSEMDPFVRSVVNAGGIAIVWDALELADKRRLVRALVTPVVHRIERRWNGRNGANRERVELVWR